MRTLGSLITKAALLLLLIWLWYWLGLAATLLLLEFMPWDATSMRPPVGDWQRTINDWLEDLPIWLFFMLSFLVVIVEGILLLGRRRAAGGLSVALVIEFIATTGLVLLFIFFWHEAAPVLRKRHEWDFGPARTWPRIGGHCLALLLLFYVQGSGLLPRLLGRRFSAPRAAYLVE